MPIPHCRLTESKAPQDWTPNRLWENTSCISHGSTQKPRAGGGSKAACSRCPQHPDFESWVRSLSVVGTADDVRSRIQGYAEKGWENMHFIARSYFPGLGAKRQRESVLALAEIRSCLDRL